ncbi:50S ribosomal protein L32 [Buchnera aphidicola (Neophyllaphis varicolor)]|uniref:50S ribosomal protein L32 n=1 Tax=Buchnera aphidicola TaxID=9 RepID=UPI0031B8A163
MAVQKSKPTRSKRGKRRSHSALKIPAISNDRITGEKHLFHHITTNKNYKGKKIFK